VQGLSVCSSKTPNGKKGTNSNMSRIIVVIGYSGTGKTFALKGLQKADVNLISPNGFC
jgi:guanylate kinase